MSICKLQTALYDSEETKWVIRSRKSKRDTQCSSQKKKGQWCKKHYTEN